MAFGRSTNILALFNSNTLNLMMLWWLMKGCMGQRTPQRFCNAVVWIAELVRVTKSWKLGEISLTTLF